MKRGCLTFRKIVQERCFLYANLFSNSFYSFLSLTHATFTSLTTACTSFKSMFEQRFTLQSVFRAWDIDLSVFQKFFFVKLSIQGLDCEIGSFDFSPCILFLFAPEKYYFYCSHHYLLQVYYFFACIYRICCSLSSLILPSLILLFFSYSTLSFLLSFDHISNLGSAVQMSVLLFHSPTPDLEAPLSSPFM